MTLQREILTTRLTWLYQLYREGYKLPPAQMAFLLRYNFIDRVSWKKYKKAYNPDTYQDRRKTKFDVAKNTEPYISPESRILDAFSDVIEEYPESTQELMVVAASNLTNPSSSLGEDAMTEELQVVKDKIKRYHGKMNITKEDWQVQRDSKGNYEPDFVKWIDSINLGWQYKIENNKFNMYRQQAMDWINENDNFANYYDDIELLKEYLREEQRRIRDNRLYFVNKYGKTQDDIDESGVLDVTAWEAQEVALYLIDCYLSPVFLKPRQIGFSTVILLGALGRLIVSKAHFSKFITEDADKGKEIFNDKLKFSLSKLPEELIPTVANDSEQILRFMYKPEKGRQQGVNSRMMVMAPKESAINGGSPTAVYVDEIGMIDILDKMLSQARAAMYRVNPKTGLLELSRQIIAWGTGGKMEKAGRVLEVFFMSVKEQWEKRNFRNGFIPVFLNAFAKEGFNMDFYEQEKEAYYSLDKEGEMENKIIFHQSYPLSLEDIFLSSHETLIPLPEIVDQINRIDKQKAQNKIKSRKGFLSPIYDTTRPIPLPPGVKPDENFIPYVIIGAQFHEVDDVKKEWYIEIIDEPEPNWMYRYYEGTDPIITNVGHSKMASAIWDNLKGGVAAVMNMNNGNFKQAWLQSLLLGIYYDANVKELCEQNNGEPYMEWKKSLGWAKTITPSTRLPKHLRVGVQKMGLNKRGNNAKFILQEQEQMLEVYKERINCREYFVQLKTFVKKKTKEGHVKYEPENKRFYYDDVLDAVTYSYINAGCYSNLPPRFNGEESTARRVINKLVMDKNTWTLKRVKMYEQTKKPVDMEDAI